eukprot:GHVT01001570.1.p1 GENE.GHVT01001570.1~~GHVT01001570.1.p1  ORF type:complete len:164 (+),score=24.25 GHVT01001570.1:595-1086(+)
MVRPLFGCMHGPRRLAESDEAAGKEKENRQPAQAVSCQAAWALDPRRVHEDADAPAEGLGRQILRELGAHDSTVAMRPADLSPNYPVVRPLPLPLGAVDVGDALAQVKVGLLARLDAFQLQQRTRWVLVRARPLVSEYDGPGVQADGFLGCPRFAHCVEMNCK